jgi:hypothetical protein
VSSSAFHLPGAPGVLRRCAIIPCETALTWASALAVQSTTSSVLAIAAVLSLSCFTNRQCCAAAPDHTAVIQPKPTRGGHSA